MSVIVSVVAENTDRVIGIQDVSPDMIGKQIDPVMYAKNGCPLMEPAAIKTLIETIIPLADVLTPNILEAEKIVGGRIKSVVDMEKAAKAIHTMGCGAVEIPIVVIGGIGKENAMLFQPMGIDGLAVASAVIAQPDIKKSAADLKSLFFGKEAVNEF